MNTPSIDALYYVAALICVCVLCQLYIYIAHSKPSATPISKSEPDAQEQQLLDEVRKRLREFERPINDTSLESIETCISLRNLIHAHIRKEFKRKEDELFRLRIDAFKALDW